MAMVELDRVQITVSGQLFGETWMNVFHYVIGATTDAESLQNMTTAFLGAYITAATPIMSTFADIRFVDAKNLTNGVDIATVSGGPTTGDQTGECLPSFVAYGFRLNRTNGSTRHGHKRLPGVAEANVVNGVVVAGALTLLNDFADFLAAPLVQGTTTFWPIIIGRYPQEHVNAGELNLAVVNSVASAVYTNLTTQNTRKPGRGI